MKKLYSLLTFMVFLSVTQVGAFRKLKEKQQPTAPTQSTQPSAQPTPPAGRPGAGARPPAATAPTGKILPDDVADAALYTVEEAAYQVYTASPNNANAIREQVNKALSGVRPVPRARP